MKRFFAFCRKALSHLNLILSLMMLTFFVIDHINESMFFLNNALTKWLLALFSVLVLIRSVISIVRETPSDPKKNENKKETRSDNEIQP